MARNPPNISCYGTFAGSLWCQAWNYQLPQLCVGATQSSIDKKNTTRWTLQSPEKKKRSRQNAHRNVWPNNIFYWSKKCGCGHLCVISILVCIYLQLRPFYSTDNAIGIIMGPKLGWVKKIQEIRAIVVDVFTGSRYRKRWAFTPFWTWPGGMNEILFVKMGVTNFSFLFLLLKK